MIGANNMAVTTQTTIQLLPGAKPLYFRCYRCDEPIPPTLLGLSKYCLEHETELLVRLLKLEGNRQHRNAKVQEWHARKNGK